MGSQCIAGKELEEEELELELRLERMGGEEMGLRRDVSFLLLLLFLISRFKFRVLGFPFTRL